MLQQIERVLAKGLERLNTVSRLDNRTEVVFTTREWEQLTELVKILKPFQELTDMLQGDKVSLSQ